ncbi:MAG: hypothetical protein Q9188_001427 [Gyalolechia gomerana]
MSRPGSSQLAHNTFATAPATGVQVFVQSTKRRPISTRRVNHLLLCPAWETTVLSRLEETVTDAWAGASPE